MFRTLTLAALLLAPTALIAAPQAQYEQLRAPAGKTVTGWRPLHRQASAVIKCHPDPTKAFLCNGRTAPSEELAARARKDQLSER